MKNTNEIWEKISLWDAKRKNSVPAYLWTKYDDKVRGDQCVTEYILGVIDALLWVIGDESGKEI